MSLLLSNQLTYNQVSTNQRVARSSNADIPINMFEPYGVGYKQQQVSNILHTKHLLLYTPIAHYGYISGQSQNSY